MNPLSLHPRIFGCIVAVSATVFVAGCGRKAAGARGPQAVPVLTALAAKRDVPVIQTAIGNVQALRSVGVKSQVDGVIAEMHFREGDEVTAGDLLVTLDRRPFENSVRSAEAELANARAVETQAVADEERYRTLVEQMTVSKEQYAQFHARAESARAGVQAREAALANAKLQLSYTEIRAPIAGRTGQLNLHEGALVKANDAGQPILTINQLSPISVAYSVPESVLHDVRAALSAGSVKVTVPARGASTTPLEGRLDFVDNSVDPSTGTILLKAVFENADRGLWPGEFVEVTTFVGEQQGAVTVPAASVQTGQRGSQVFVVKKDQTVELHPVKVGRQAQSDLVILEGVQAGDEVVTDGQLRLVPGAKIDRRSPSEAGPGVVSAETASGTRSTFKLP
ncbi:efflux RND transporter periplasmic adaptor subunit [Opitutaceae bacterium EW11]|nr:efflux RND transporter periplasmic adaptor subunit [Opitutaceae bacterium EW11]